MRKESGAYVSNPVPRSDLRVKIRCCGYVHEITYTNRNVLVIPAEHNQAPAAARVMIALGVKPRCVTLSERYEAFKKAREVYLAQRDAIFRQHKYDEESAGRWASIEENDKIFRSVTRAHTADFPGRLRSRIRSQVDAIIRESYGP